MNPVHIRTTRQRNNQRGLGLLEILIGLAIGLLVVAAALGALASVRTAATSSSESTRMQEQVDAAFRLLGHHLRQTRSIGLTPRAGGTVRFASLIDMQNQEMPALGSVNGVQGASDTLTVAYHGDASMLTSDCNGDPAPASAKAEFLVPLVNSFSVRNNELVCQGSVRAGQFGLLQGVEGFEVMFLQRTGAESEYLAVPDDWSSVVAVSVCLQMVSAAAGFVDHRFVDCQGQQAQSVDGRLRRSFTRVFQLRNT
jgi:type IV pilus assembly protein PilW